jgi:hypothetical protein
VDLGLAIDPLWWGGIPRFAPFEKQVSNLAMRSKGTASVFVRERRYLLATVAIAIVLTHFSKGASARYPGFE